MTAPDKITLARRLFSEAWRTLEPGETMSHGYVEAEPYHHQRVVDELVEALERVSRRVGAALPLTDTPTTEQGLFLVSAKRDADALIAKHRKGGA